MPFALSTANYSVLSVEFPKAGVWFQFSADGRHLAVTTDSRSVRLFDAPTLAELDSPRLPVSPSANKELRHAAEEMPKKIAPGAAAEAGVR